MDVDREFSTGTLTFLFTDIENSTALWERNERGMSRALAAHDRVIRDAVHLHDGLVFKHTGDGICAAFHSAREALAAALQVQRFVELPVRIGVHTGDAELRDGDYYGSALNVAARVMDAGHGGQVLASAGTAALVPDLAFVDLGEYRLKGITDVVRILQANDGSFPALRTPNERRGNLPEQMTEFIGRQVQVAELLALVAAHRVVTLFGAGGVGKTRLAIETARAAAFPDGCWWVELAPVASGDGVLFAFTAGLGIRAPERGEIVDSIIAAIRHKRLLVVVDNCEHMLNEAANAIEAIVQECRHVTVLATSREPLMIAGEHLVTVTSLTSEEAQRLFVERARSEAPDVEIDAIQSAAVVELCERLDRLPLPIELAASRARTFTPVEIAASLDDRLRLLVGGRRSRNARHETMRDTLDWSYKLCNDIERRVFDRLSVFPSSFDLAAARAVGMSNGVSDGDVIDIVSRLIDKSLVQRTTTTAEGTSRYALLETMRAYGREHLDSDGDADATGQRHAHHIEAVVVRLAQETIGPDEDRARGEILQLLPDVYLAFEWFRAHRDWRRAYRVANLGVANCERQEVELRSLLRHAIAESGEEPHFYALLSLEREQWDLGVADANKKAWAMIDGGWRAPTDHVSTAPHDFIQGDDTSGMRAGDLVASLDQLGDAPLLTRYDTEHTVLRNLTTTRPDLVRDRLPSFIELVESSGSRTGQAALADLRGQLAFATQDWAEALNHFDTALRILADAPKYYFEVRLSFYRMVAKAMSHDTVAIAELREPWDWLRDGHLDVLRWWGASATSVALDALARPELAAAFRQWIVQNDPGGVGAMIANRLAGTGFALDRRMSVPVDLEELVDQSLV